MILRKKNFFALIAMLIVIILLLSSTIGREIMAGRQPSLFYFGLVHFAGYLFFLLMPVEALVPYYLTVGHDPIVLLILSIVTAFIAQTIDYSVGYFLSERVVDTFITREKFEHFKKVFDRWGGWAIFVFNLFPLSSPNMLLVSGIMRHNLLKTALFSASGLLVKYFVIVYITTGI